MITEDYVSFEIAKLLKEKGFNEKVDTFYKTDEEFLKSTLCINYNDAEFTLLDMHNIPENTVSAPTLQMAMKWLRETFEIHCQIDCPIAASNWVYGIRNLNQDEWITLRNMGDYDTYEEACESAIKYCLENLI